MAADMCLTHVHLDALTLACTVNTSTGVSDTNDLIPPKVLAYVHCMLRYKYQAYLHTTCVVMTTVERNIITASSAHGYL